MCIRDRANGSGGNVFEYLEIREITDDEIDRMDRIYQGVDWGWYPDKYCLLYTSRTTKAQRTGCSMCGFGVHMEKRPHRFDQKRQENPKEWEYLMYRMVKDTKTGEVYGWGKVLDYIGVGWEDIPPVQMSLLDFPEVMP